MLQEVQAVLLESGWHHESIVPECSGDIGSFLLSGLMADQTKEESHMAFEIAELFWHSCLQSGFYAIKRN